MTDRIYLGDFLGWDTEARAKVALSQLREEKIISKSKCPKVQLLRNRFDRYVSNSVKILGYVPVLHVIVGIATIIFAPKNESYLRPNHKAFWIARGVAVLVFGPLLFIADLGKFMFDCIVVAKYNRENRDLIQQFNTSHGHTREYWPGHPIRCQG